MEYFWIRQDHRRPHACLIENLSNVPGYLEFQKGNWDVLEEFSVINVLPGQLICCPDILDRQFFMVRGVFREVLNLFLPSLEYKDVCLIDAKAEEHVYYEIPRLKIVECYSKANKVKVSYDTARQLVLDKSSLPLEHVFRVAGAFDTVIVGTLAVVEALLRRKPIGIQILPIELI